MVEGDIMRENVKNMVLVLALVIAGVSLPTSAISFMREPTIIVYENTIVEQYNNTIIEEYNYTIIEEYNNTIIELYNNTIIYNNTIYDYANQTIELYHFYNIADESFFLNLTYDITNDTLFQITGAFNNYVNHPGLQIFKDSASIIDLTGGNGIGWGINMILGEGFYEFRFKCASPYPNNDCVICIISWVIIT